MERDELSRLRAEFEQLYQQSDSTDSTTLAQHSKSDRLTGLWRTLQIFWQRTSAFLTEDTGDYGQGNLHWWQMHHLRMGGYNPAFLDQDTSYKKVWLERIYRD